MMSVASALTTSYRLWADFPSLSETPLWLAALLAPGRQNPKAVMSSGKMNYRPLTALIKDYLPKILASK
jgi:hypothetical protein